MPSESKKRGGEAVRSLIRANRLENISRPADRSLNIYEARQARAEAENLLRPIGELVAGAGEVVHVDPTDSEDRFRKEWLIDTLRHPHMVAVDASEQRMEAADAAGILEAAADASESVQAGNSLEKMLCHQLAGLHHFGMKLLARAADNRLPPVEMVRLTNAAARLIQVYQEGFLALQKIRAGGKQIVVVQHVQVSEGGQAVIAGSMKTGDRGLMGEGEGDENA